MHFSIPAGGQTPRPGDLVTVPVTGSAAFHLVSDPATLAEYSVRRSRAGDAWDRSQAESCGTGTTGTKNTSGVSLGMPALPARK